MQWLIDIVTEWIVAAGYLLHSFVDRGDPAAVDYITGDFTKDNTWYELDLSGVVPAGAKAVAITIVVFTTAVGSELSFRRAGNLRTINKATIMTQVANIFLANDLVIAVDSDRKIEYRASVATWVVINVSVKGWWL